ncbi:ROK family protein [Photorhabdus asymbiotica]|uniref:ROK family protein n=1 Tax=Photorhabdus asymbiotica TaxID=291112 RepID=UPI003DA7925D
MTKIISKKRLIVVIDIGGTYLRCAFWNNKGVTHLIRESSPSFIKYPDDNVLKLKERLINAIIEKLPTIRNSLTVSISLGAALNHNTGEVYGSAPLWGANEVNFNLLDELYTKRPDIHWILMNDVTAMAIHFASQHICRNVRKAMLITISSGIACRVFETSPFNVNFDRSGLQGEIGHLPYSNMPLYLECDCGTIGHLAAYSSGRGIHRIYDYLYQEKYGESQSHTNFEDYFKNKLQNGDKFCIDVLKTAMQPLADIISTSIVLDPSIELVGLSGGVTDSLPLFVKNAIIERLISHGPYITAKHNQKWLNDFIFICPHNTASALYGAGIAAEKYEDEWIKRHIPNKG